jgi:N-acetylmuramic acid 6-phosphate etherase
MEAHMTIDNMDDQTALRFMLDIQSRAIASVPAAFNAIAKAAHQVADVIGSGGRLIYCGAGSSGLIALQDGAELPGTFGINPEQIVFLLAGGLENAHNLVGHVEDDEGTALRAVEALGPLSSDVMIAISASGSTPYTLAAARAAKRAGSKIISIANKPQTPLLACADIPISVPTPDEAITGSTRMAAGTVQKCILGLISTLAHTQLGHVYQGEMVNLRADNEKLRIRAVDIVSRITGVSRDQAKILLEKGSQNVKDAVLLAEGAADPEHARTLLSETKGQLPAALDRLKSDPKL